MLEFKVRFFEQDMISRETGKVVKPNKLCVEKSGGIDIRSTFSGIATEEDILNHPAEYAAFLESKKEVPASEAPERVNMVKKIKKAIKA